MSDIHRTQTGNIFMSWAGGISLTFIRQTVTIDEWKQMIALTQAQGDTRTRLSLVWVGDADISAEQRQLTADMEKGVTRPPLLALVLLTDSRLARGALTAYSWLKAGPTKYKAFGTAEVDSALTWLSALGECDVAQTRTLLARMQQLAKETQKHTA